MSDESFPIEIMCTIMQYSDVYAYEMIRFTCTALFCQHAKIGCEYLSRSEIDEIRKISKKAAQAAFEMRCQKCSYRKPRWGMYFCIECHTFTCRDCRCHKPACIKIVSA